MRIKLETIKSIDTSDVLYDKKLKQFCVYPKTDAEYDVKYIKENCLKVKK
jgi:hypothetical protein